MSDEIKPDEFELKVGAKLPEFQEGTEGPSVWSAATMNNIVKSVNVWLNPSISRGEKDGVEISDSNVQITLKRSEGGGASIERFKVRFAENDFLICRTWDGTTIGATDIYVLKPEELQCSLASEAIYGVTTTYTYAADTAEPYMAFGDGGTWPGEEATDYDVGEALYQKRLNVIRTATRSGVVEAQRVVKVWGKGQVIRAIECDGGLTTAGSVAPANQPITHLLLASNRNWARV
jgi:hypothetical protein